MSLHYYNDHHLNVHRSQLGTAPDFTSVSSTGYVTYDSHIQSFVSRVFNGEVSSLKAERTLRCCTNGTRRISYSLANFYKYISNLKFIINFGVLFAFSSCSVRLLELESLIIVDYFSF